MRFVILLLSGIVAIGCGALLGLFVTMLAIVPDETPEVIERVAKEKVCQGIILSAVVWGSALTIFWARQSKRRS